MFTKIYLHSLISCLIAVSATGIDLGLTITALANQPSPADLTPWTTVDAIAADPTTAALPSSTTQNKRNFSQVTPVSQLSDVQPTDWAFQALQSLVEKYGCIAGYPDSTFRGNRAATRYELAAALNACLDVISDRFATKEDLQSVRKLQEEFAAEMALLRGRIDHLESRTARLEANQFSTTTKLNAQVITAFQDVFGDRVGGTPNNTNPIYGYRVRFNVETSFTGKDLLRTRLEFSNFGSVAVSTGSNMTQLNFGSSTDDQVILPHLLYRFPLSPSLTITTGPLGIGYTDITDTLTPPTIADDSLGIPSQFGEYSPLYRQGGGGAALNWSISKDLIFTLGYLAGNPASPIAPEGGFFGGKYNALAQLAYYQKWGAIGAAYSHSYAPRGQVDLTGSTGSFLAIRPFGDQIATSSDTIGLQGYYRISPNFQIHAWGGYINASAEESGSSQISDGRGGNITAFVNNGSNASAWFGAIGFTLPDVTGKGNLPGILVGLPPRVTSSDVRRDPDSSYHIEAFYRYQVNDNISITPDFWVVINPENDRQNATQYVGVIRASFNF
jgi:Carbohydrate-selective porin, OprB family/S-layer homology domain